MSAAPRALMVALAISASLLQAEELETPKTQKAVIDAVVWLNQQARLQDARHIEATWLQAHPDDADVLGMQAATLMLQANGEADATRATDLRKQAFGDATRARQLGSKEIMIDLVLARTDASGRGFEPEVAVASSLAVKQEMAKGEQAFGRRDLAEALAAYQRAWALDPHCYEAALYTGDAYFAQQRFAEAIEWFGKACTLDPNRETAFRYLGDACLRAQKVKEARSAYIDAVIAAPYSRLTRNALQKFAEVTGRPLRAPQVQRLPAKVAWDNGKVQVSVDPKAGSLLLAYALGRARWNVEERAKYFDAAAKPRHALYEECAGLRLLIATAAEAGANEDAASRELKPTIATLAAIDKAGLLEPFVLLDAADEGIAQDYPAFRQLHRDALVRYINEFWFPPAPGQAALKAGAKGGK